MRNQTQSGTMRLSQLESSSLRDRAHAAIRASISTGELEADTIHPVSFLTARLGVSATPVREALLDLANEGLVEVLRNRGFRIPTLTEKDLDEIFQLRLMLEVPALVQICRKLTDEQIEELSRYVEDLEDCAQTGNIAGFLETDRVFHTRLLETQGNQRLVTIVSRLRDHARLHGLPGLAMSGKLVASAQEHRHILNAVVAGDATECEKWMIKHLEHTRGIWAGREED